MHPEILREITSQRGRELRTQAHEARMARMFRALRHGASARHEADEFVVPAIPDFVDGSFLSTPAEDTAASEPTVSRHVA
jgi:hypothetical protein